MTFSKDKAEQFLNWIAEAGSIVITAHKSPDGDSIGCSLGLYHYLTKKGYSVTICHPDPAPSFLHWMDGFDKIITLEENEEEVKQKMRDAGLIFCLDYNGSGRIGKMEELLLASNANKIMIDHHRDPDENLCELMFSDFNICSTSQMIFELIDACGDVDLIDEKIGTPLYCGIVTDTGSFRFSSTTAKTHEVAAVLITKGVKHWKVHENVFDSGSLDRLRMWSYALLEKLIVLQEFKTAYISITEAEEERFNAIKGDTEGLVNQALGIEGVKMAVFFKESEGLIKLSFRSKDSIPVNELASNHFSGGGHLNASGGKFLGKMDDAIKKFEDVLTRFYEQNKSHFE